MTEREADAIRRTLHGLHGAPMAASRVALAAAELLDRPPEDRPAAIETLGALVLSLARRLDAAEIRIATLEATVGLRPACVSTKLQTHTPASPRSIDQAEPTTPTPETTP